MGPFCCSVAIAAAPRVTLSRESFRALLDRGVEAPEAVPAPLLVRRDVQVGEHDAERLTVVARWKVVVPAPADVSWVVAGPEVRVERVTLDGVAAQVASGPDGAVLTAHLTRDTTVELRGSVLRSGPWTLLPAASGQIEHPAGVVVEGAIPIGARRAAGASARLALVPPPIRAHRDLSIGESALGLVVGDAEMSVRGVVRYRVSGQPVHTVSFTVEGAGPDLEVRGPQVAAWRRDGDQVQVDLREPERSLVNVDVSWSVPTPRGEAHTLPVPRILPQGVFKSSAVLQISRDPEIDVIPELRGWSVAAPSALPAWGRGLAPGTAVGAFTGRGEPATMTVLRFSPASSPPTIIDVASFSGLVSPEGRLLLRATYAVRNDRAARLRVVPPPGMTPIGATRSGRAVTVARDGDVWLVPLEKSVETVGGLLAFPVEVVFWGDVPEWDPVHGTSLALPAVDAEVAVARLSLSLPRDWAARVAPGEGDAVEQFTAGDGITYGYAIGDTRAAEAVVLFQQAVDAWKNNRFDETARTLDRLEGMGAKSEGIDQLRSNLAVVDGEATGLVERRVLEQARARSIDDELAQQQELSRAERAYAAGEYDEAEEAYQRALDLGGDLAKLRNKEDAAQEALNEEVAQKLTVTRDVKLQKSAQAQSNALAAAPPVVEPVVPEGQELQGGLRETTVPVFMGAAATLENTYVLDGVDVRGPVDQANPDEQGRREPTVQVTAANLGVILPVRGETIHYQTLLLPPGTTWDVSIRAKPLYRVPRRTL